MGLGELGLGEMGQNHVTLVAIGAGNRGAWGAVAPPTKLLGEQLSK